MRNGSLLGIAEVFKSLVVLQGEKSLSFREKKMLDRARHMLVTELSLSRGLSEFEAADVLEKALAKASLALFAFPARTGRTLVPNPTQPFYGEALITKAAIRRNPYRP